MFVCSDTDYCETAAGRPGIGARADQEETLRRRHAACTPLLQVKDMTKTYGAPDWLCRNVGFDLYPGEVMGIVGRKRLGQIDAAELPGGPSGAGCG